MAHFAVSSNAELSNAGPIQQLAGGARFRFALASSEYCQEGRSVPLSVWRPHGVLTCAETKTNGQVFRAHCPESR